MKTRQSTTTVYLLIKLVMVGETQNKSLTKWKRPRWNVKLSVTCNCNNKFTIYK